MHEKAYYTYIVASRTHVLYIGVTSNLERRVAEHRSRTGTGFTARYGCDRLVWYERFADPTTAIAREKELKGWSRMRKIALIEEENRTWTDLSAGWGMCPVPFPPNKQKATADPSLAQDDTRLNALVYPVTGAGTNIATVMEARISAQGM